MPVCQPTFIAVTTDATNSKKQIQQFTNLYTHNYNNFYIIIVVVVVITQAAANSMIQIINQTN